MSLKLCKLQHPQKPQCTPATGQFIKYIFVFLNDTHRSCNSKEYDGNHERFQKEIWRSHNKNKKESWCWDVPHFHKPRSLWKSLKLLVLEHKWMKARGSKLCGHGSSWPVVCLGAHPWYQSRYLVRWHSVTNQRFNTIPGLTWAAQFGLGLKILRRLYYVCIRCISHLPIPAVGEPAF